MWLLLRPELIVFFPNQRSALRRKNGEIEEYVKHRIKARWSEWRLTSRVLRDWHRTTRLKENFYKATIRTTITYGA